MYKCADPFVNRRAPSHRLWKVIPQWCKAFQPKLHIIGQGWAALCSSKAKGLHQENGLLYIRVEGPQSNVHNRRTEWTELESHREDGPIFDWSAGLVKESLKNYASANGLVETDFLTFKDLKIAFPSTT